MNEIICTSFKKKQGWRIGLFERDEISFEIWISCDVLSSRSYDTNMWVKGVGISDKCRFVKRQIIRKIIDVTEIVFLSRSFIFDVWSTSFISYRIKARAAARCASNSDDLLAFLKYNEFKPQAVDDLHRSLVSKCIRKTEEKSTVNPHTQAHNRRSSTRRWVQI